MGIQNRYGPTFFLAAVMLMVRILQISCMLLGVVVHHDSEDRTPLYEDIELQVPELIW